MTVWIIWDETTNRAFEVTFETREACELYIRLFGTDEWKPRETACYSLRDVHGIIEYMK